MGVLQDRVAVVTGGGRGVGREHALALAAEGAKVVINDLGGGGDGSGSDVSAAQSVADEIVASGGQAIANTNSVMSWEGAESIVADAVRHFGDLHIVVCNAGILRDRMVVSMTEDDYDMVMGVHAKGTYAVVRHAAAYWRAQSKLGVESDRSVITTASHAGLVGPVGQSNYAAAKSAIAGMTMSMARELARFKGRANCVVPIARTRLIMETPGTEMFNPPEDADAFDEFHPGNISPLVAYLAAETCTNNGEFLGIHGGTICRYRRWEVESEFHHEGRWTIDALADELGELEPIVVRTQMDVVREQLTP